MKTPTALQVFLEHTRDRDLRTWHDAALLAEKLARAERDYLRERQYERCAVCGTKSEARDIHAFNNVCAAHADFKNYYNIDLALKERGMQRAPMPGFWDSYTERFHAP